VASYLTEEATPGSTDLIVFDAFGVEVARVSFDFEKQPVFTTTDAAKARMPLNSTAS
jgi:hypothetical protein